MGRRILLADDSVTIQKVIELTFAERDYEIEAVSDGTSAITRLTEHRPDLVLADVHMPGASGLEVCRLAKELHPGLPVVLMVGTFEPFEEADATAAGADTFVKKPFDSQELQRLVADLLARGAAAPAEGTAAAAGWQVAAPAAQPVAAQALPADLPPDSAVLGETDEEVDLESWDKLEIATGEDEEAAGEPVWGNLDDALGDDALGDDALGDDALSDDAFAASGALAPEARPPETTPWMPLERPEPSFPDFSSAEEGAVEDLSAEEGAAVAQPFAVGFDALSGEMPELPVGGYDEPEPEADDTAAMTAPDLFEVPAARLAHSAVTTGAVTTGAVAVAPPVAPAVPVSLDRLSDEDVDRVARRVIELLGDKVVRDIAWEVIPDVAELVIKDRIRELEAQADGTVEP